MLVIWQENAGKPQGHSLQSTLTIASVASMHDRQMPQDLVDDLLLPLPRPARMPERNHVALDADDTLLLGVERPAEDHGVIGAQVVARVPVLRLAVVRPAVEPV